MEILEFYKKQVIDAIQEIDDEKTIMLIYALTMEKITNSEEDILQQGSL